MPASSVSFHRALDCLAPATFDANSGSGAFSESQASGAALPLMSVRPAGLEAVLAGLPAGTAAFVRAAGFEAEAGRVMLLPGGDGMSGALLGLGDDQSPWAHGGLATALPAGSVWTLVEGDFDHDSAVLGFCLGAYRYGAMTSRQRPTALLAGAEQSPALALVRAIWLARDLINTPANHLGPAELADATVALGARHGAVTRRIEGDALEAGYPALAAVGRGSARAPVVASFTWCGSAAGADAKHISLCGKGVCFDTGGYDLKPSAAMLRMKKDMGGAALMLGLASAIMEQDLPLRLTVRIGCAENMVSGNAMRPLDVLRTRRGLTVEVGNTDAEGRLLLCDLMAEASDERPDLMLDAATLTGAARVALGPDIPAIFTPDDEIAGLVARCAAKANDPVWRLPLHADYDPWLSSPVADIANVSSKGHAGAVIAGLFLQRFVRSGVRWMHIDTYAWNDSSRAGRPEGGDAQGLRTLLLAVAELTLL